MNMLSWPISSAISMLAPSCWGVEEENGGIRLQSQRAAGAVQPEKPRTATPHHGADDERAIHGKLHVARAAGLRARGGDVLAAAMKAVGHKSSRLRAVWQQ